MSKQLQEQWSDIVDKDPLSELLEQDKEYLWSYRCVCVLPVYLMRSCRLSTCIDRCTNICSILSCTYVRTNVQQYLETYVHA